MSGNLKLFIPAQHIHTAVHTKTGYPFCQFCFFPRNKQLPAFICDPVPQRQACPRNNIITNEISPINKAFSTDCIIASVKTHITGGNFSRFPFLTFRQAKIKTGIIIAGVRHQRKSKLGRHSFFIIFPILYQLSFGAM